MLAQGAHVTGRPDICPPRTSAPGHGCFRLRLNTIKIAGDVCTDVTLGKPYDTQYND